MRDYGRVYSKFWTSGDIQALTDDGKMLALYLLSGPHGTIAGVCRLPDGYVCEDLKWSIERVSKGFSELLLNGFVDRCGTTKWVWIRRFLEWNTPENPNQWKAARKMAESVPSNCAWKADFSSVFALSAGDALQPIDNPSSTVPKGLPTQEQDQKQEQKQEQNSSRASIDAIKLAYPKFSGRQDWIAAEHFMHLRVERDGCTWNTLIESAQRYAAYCASGGVSSDQYVLTPAKFFSAADKPWAQEWAAPTVKLKTAAKPDHSAEWAEAKAAAKDIGFRDPHQGESASVYATEVRQARDAKPMVPLAERRGLAGIKRIGAT